MARGRVGSVAVVLALAALLATPGPGSATHVRPRGATPLRLPLVLAYKQCVAPNRTHGAPLAFPSCAPPDPTTNHYLTVGTPDANGAAANSVGSLEVQAITGDVRFTLRVTDIRCLPAVSATVCNSANAVDGPDYSGNMQLNAVSRITDHFNGPGLNEAATMTDIPYPMDVNCANTGSTAVGGECTTDTTANALVPGAFQAGERTIWQLDKFQVFDAGADGNIHMGDPATTLFLTQGVFVP
jgi:hypothetical protein